jgi:prolyl oligopeptidase
MPNTSLSYPVTEKGNVIDRYFDTDLADPYRWLEDDRSVKTGDWVKTQNQLTNSYLSDIPYTAQLKKRLAELFDYERLSAPFKEGIYTYFYKNDGLQDQSVLYRQKAPQPPQIFLDPNTFSEDGTSSLAGTFFSADGSVMTYLISEGGSDWRTAITINTDNQQEISSRLIDIKFSRISWLHNQGFYYSSYDKPQGSELSAKTDQHKLYFHRLGSQQKDDKLIFGGSQEQKNRYVGATVTQDSRYLVIEAANSTSGNKLYLKHLNIAGSELLTILDDYDSDTVLLDNNGHTLLFETNRDAPNNRVVAVNADDPGPNRWQNLIDETEHVLQTVTGAGYIFAQYMVDAVCKVQQLDMQGRLVRHVALPGVGSVSGFSGKKQQNDLHFTYTNYTTPGTIYNFDANTGDSSVYATSKVQFTAADYESKQVFYRSKDGANIPMIISYKKGTVLNGQNPTILYGYGGFNVSLMPQFSPVIAAWLELGGIYAVANLRGGGEYGKKWHTAGIKLNKQNVFDDFIAAAEYLIATNYSSKDHLAIKGGSNGGLLVAAVMLQRPELFKVALPAVGVLDMLRYHTFTAGAGWSYDYGTAQDSQTMFAYLASYSPLHNVKSGVNYPATLITTGDHDDRVVPAHSFKFAATLQATHSGPNPTLIRVETNAGHGAGTPITKTINEVADIYGFTLHNMGLTAKKTL